MATVDHPEMESFDAGDTMRLNIRPRVVLAKTFCIFADDNVFFCRILSPPTGSKLKTKEIGDDYAPRFGGKETGVKRDGLIAGYR